MSDEKWKRVLIGNTMENFTHGSCVKLNLCLKAKSGGEKLNITRLSQYIVMWLRQMKIWHGNEFMQRRIMLRQWKLMDFSCAGEDNKIERRENFKLENVYWNENIN